MIDTVRGAQSSAIIFSLVETTKANNLNIYEYLKCLLTEVPKQLDDKGHSFLNDLLLWSDAYSKPIQTTLNERGCSIE